MISTERLRAVSLPASDVGIWRAPKGAARGPLDIVG